jgi:hypothetical protein
VHHALLAGRLTTLAVALLATSCGKDSPGTGPESSRLRVVAGSGAADTVLATPAQALVVEVQENGAPASGVVVRFEALPPSDSARRFELAILLEGLSSPNFGSFVAATTDGQGRASAIVKLGTVAGESRVRVSAPELGLEDTAKFTVRPGNAARVRIDLRDTLVYSGTKYQLRATVADRFNNARASDALTYTAGPSVTSVSATGEVTAGSIGRGWVAISSGAAVDTSRLSVVPRATIVAGVQSGSEPVSIALFELDGSNVRKLVQSAGAEFYPRISKSGAQIVFSEGDPSYGAPQLFVVDVNGKTRRPLLSPSSVLVASAFASFTPDEQWVYFTGHRLGEQYGIWRAHPDGSGLEPVIDVAQGTPMHRSMLSPDGTKLVYLESSAIKVRDLTSGVTTSLNVQGTHPHFSPDGQYIAYQDFYVGKLRIMRADGSESRVVAPTRDYGETVGFDFTADGQWIIAGGSPPELVNASTGLVLPLPYSFHVFQPSVVR